MSQRIGIGLALLLLCSGNEFKRKANEMKHLIRVQQQIDGEWYGQVAIAGELQEYYASSRIAVICFLIELIADTGSPNGTDSVFVNGKCSGEFKAFSSRW